MKTQIRRFLDAIAARDLQRAETEFCVAAKRIDQIAAKGSIHPNAASRRKSRLQRRLSSLRAAVSRAPS